jgi:hypothetical protein
VGVTAVLVPLPFLMNRPKKTTGPTPVH